jgi:hypothetical protein
VGLKWELAKEFGFDKVTDFVYIGLELWAGVDSMSRGAEGKSTKWAEVGDHQSSDAGPMYRHLV